MFEQSFVDASGRQVRPWAVPAAAAGQVLMVCGAIAVPLLFTDILPSIRLAAPSLHFRALEPMPVRTTSRAAAPSVSSALRPVVRAAIVPPTRVPTGVARIEDAPELATAGAGSISSGEGGPAIPGLLPGLMTATPVAPAPEPPKIKPQPDQPDKPVRVKVGGAVRPPELVHYVKPAYPPLARQARIQGPVRLSAVLARNGAVTALQLVSGHPLLVQAALDAVRTWRYRPTMLNNEPVEVAMTIDVNFTLSQ